MTSAQERREAEEALRLSEARFRGIVSISSDAIITIDEARRIIIFNDGAERIFGYSRAEAIGAPLDSLIPERLRVIHRQHLERFAAGEATARRMGDRSTIEGRRKNGEEFPAEAAISKIEVGGQRLLTVVLRDITERKRMENEVRFLADAAQRATQARDEMLGIVAHDLRNPLTAINLAAQVLERQLSEEGAERGMKSVQTIRRCLRRANRLIEDLLDVMRVEAGKLSIERARLSAEQLVFDAVEEQQLLAASASLELRLDVERPLPEVWADRDRLLQVLENLISNAIKFTSPGGRITVGAGPGHGEVRFWVADTGPGIATEDLPHVFDRFWQAKRAQRSGAGLGLMICKGIVDAHGGRIWVETTPGRGATFYFTMPTG